MKRKIASIAAVFCLLLSAVYLPCFVLAEDDTVPSTESTDASNPATEPATEELIPVDVRLTMEVQGDRVNVKLQTSDGSLPLGLPVVLVVDGRSAAEGTVIDGDLSMAYTIQPGDRLYRVYTENFTLDGKVYQAAMAEEYVDYDDYFLDTSFFEYDTFHFDSRTGLLELTWNYTSYGNSHAADVAMVHVGGVPVVFSGSRGQISADLSGRPNGVYDLQLTLMAGDLAATVDAGAVNLMVDVTPVLTVEPESDGRLCVTVTDAWGTPLSGVAVNMRVGATTYLPERTDADGKARFTKPAGDAKITFSTQVTEMNGYSVLVSSVLYGDTPHVTVPPIESTDTTVTTEVTRPPVTTSRTTTPVTETTYPEPTVTGAGTTGIATDGMVAMNVTYEQVLESLLGVTAEQMSDYGRLFMAPELFDLYVSDTKSSLSLFLRAREMNVSDSEVANALRAGNVGKFTAKDAYSIAVGMSLLLSSDGSSTEMPVLDGQYVVQLPVPEGLQTADACAVAYYDATTGIQKAVLVTPTEGYIRFTTDKLGTFVLLGLYPGANNGSLFWPILLIVFGCLLVICGALLIWLRVAGASVVAGLLGGTKRTPTAEAETAEAETAEEEQLTVPLTEDVTPTAPSAVDEAIARAAAPTAASTAAATAAEEEYEDIFSSAERRDAFNHRND